VGGSGRLEPGETFRSCCICGHFQIETHSTTESMLLTPSNPHLGWKISSLFTTHTDKHFLDCKFRHHVKEKKCDKNCNHCIKLRDETLDSKEVADISQWYYQGHTYSIPWQNILNREILFILCYVPRAAGSGITSKEVACGQTARTSAGREVISVWEWALRASPSISPLASIQI